MAHGASGITVHLRGDRRHVQDSDVERLGSAIDGKVNLEMATTDEMLGIAERLRPEQVTLVPERPEEVTTEGGLDVIGQTEALTAAADRLSTAGIEVSVFVDPVEAQIARLAELALPGVTGFEINTDRYTHPGAAASELEAIVAAAALGEQVGLRVYAGHGLTVANVAPVATIPQVEELNIGHSIVSRAVLIGMAAAVEEMLAAMSV